MNINIYGDSWAWCWNYMGEDFTSKEMRLHRSKMPNPIADAAFDYFRDAFPVLKMLLTAMGHTVTVHNVPGNPFTKTVSLITESETSSECNIVFFSEIQRAGNLAQFSTHDKKLWDAEYAELLKACLNQLSDVANERQHPFFIFGGQSTLFKHEFDQYNQSQHVHLVAECVLSKILQTFLQKSHDIKTYSRYKFCDFVHLLDDTWDVLLLKEIVNGNLLTAGAFDDGPVSRALHDTMTRPDIAHMNAAMLPFFLELLFSYMEQHGYA